MQVDPLLEKVEETVQVEKSKKAEEKVRQTLKKTFEIVNSAGKLLVEVNVFTRYFFVVVTYAGLLKMDGSLQLAFPTPYSKEPTVLELLPEIPSPTQTITRQLSQQLSCPVLLSLNISLQMNKKGEIELLAALRQILKGCL